jgi:hypothetical protein
MKHEHNRDLVSQVEARRSFVGMKKKDLCAQAGITPPTYRAWISKGTNLYNIKRLQDALLDFCKTNNLNEE